MVVFFFFFFSPLVDHIIKHWTKIKEKRVKIKCNTKKLWYCHKKYCWFSLVSSKVPIQKKGEKKKKLQSQLTWEPRTEEHGLWHRLSQISSPPFRILDILSRNAVDWLKKTVGNLLKTAFLCLYIYIYYFWGWAYGESP